MGIADGYPHVSGQLQFKLYLSAIPMYPGSYLVTGLSKSSISREVTLNINQRGNHNIQLQFFYNLGLSLYITSTSHDHGFEQYSQLVSSVGHIIHKVCVILSTVPGHIKKGTTKKPAIVSPSLACLRIAICQTRPFFTVAKYKL